jgi:hypothetical protein
MDGMLVQIGNDGSDEAGGDVFDETLRNEVERRCRIERGVPEDIEISPEAKTRLMHSCERAKIDLSSRTTAKIFVPSYFVGLTDPDLEYSLTRTQLEEIVSDVLRKGFSRINRLLERCDYPPPAISMCLAAGGMSNMPAIRMRLNEMLGPQRVRIPDESGTLISAGAAWVAHDAARLHLAKRVELLLARNSSMVLIDADTKMPRQGEVQGRECSLYCADPRDGFAKLQIRVPVRPGKTVLPDDERVVLATFNVDVDPSARPLLERIYLKVTVDEDLILKADATSLNIRSQGSGEVHDLEFGVKLPRTNTDESPKTEPPQPRRQQTARAPGDVALRSNIIDREDRSAIPGELLYETDPAYFDVRTNPPQIQVDEVLYYQPCARCGRRSNDPLCTCDRRRPRPMIRVRSRT